MISQRNPTLMPNWTLKSEKIELCSTFIKNLKWLILQMSKLKPYTFPFKFSINKWPECLTDNYHESTYLIHPNHQKWLTKNERTRIIFKDHQGWHPRRLNWKNQFCINIFSLYPCWIYQIGRQKDSEMITCAQNSFPDEQRACAAICCTNNSTTFRREYSTRDPLF